MNSFNLKPWVVYAFFPFLGGILYPLGFPFADDFQIMPLSLVGVFLFLSGLPLPYGHPTHVSATKKTLKRIIITVLLFSLGYCLVGYYWIPYTLKEFGNISFPFNHLLGTAFSLIIVPHYLLFGLILFFWRKLNIKSSSLAGSLATRNLIFAILLVFLEKVVPQQFPAHLGHPWLQWAPFLGMTKYLGAAFYSFISYWFVLFFVSFVKTGKKDFFGLSFSLTLIIMNLFLPLKEDQRNEKQMTTHLRLVQANVGNFMKLNSEKGGVQSIREIYKRYEELSTQESDQKLDLIIWPETAYPRLINSAMMRISPTFVPRVVKDTVLKMETPVFFGGYDKSGNDNNYYFETEYNTAFLISEKAELIDLYHKMVLIPFGESLPFGPFNPLFAKALENLAFFAQGKSYTLFKLKEGQRFISAICYEILFSSFIRRYLNNVKEKPHFLINLTNDSWYGNTSEPFQHKFLAHWRALEFQIPIVRMTNTGITSILYEDGSESKRLPIFTKDKLDLSLKTPRDPKKTLYQKWGYLPLSLLALGFFLLAWIYEKKTKVLL